MTAYNVVNRNLLDPGDPDDITVVLANFDAIAAILNGGIDNANIAGGAAVAISKLAPGTEGQSLKTVGGVPSWAAAGGGIDYEGAWNVTLPYESGDVVNYNGIDYIAVNPGTGQAPGAVAGPAGFIGTVMPTTPIDGNEFILVDSLTTPTYAWRFRYVAGITDAYKWIFVGGTPGEHDVRPDNVEEQTSNSAAGQAFAALATPGPLFAVPRAGIYVVEIGARLWTNSGGGAFATMSYDIGATPATDADGIIGFQTQAIHASKAKLKTITAPATLTSKYKGTAAVFSAFASRWMRVTPVRVS